MLVAVVVCVLAGQPPAGAAGPVYAGIAARDPSLDASAERTAIALGQALEKRGALDVGSPPLPDAVDGAGTDNLLVNLVTAAKGKYSEGDFAAAVDKANDAVSRFEGSGAFHPGPSWSAYADALVVKALALRRLGKEADADAALSVLASTMPKAVPDPTMTPPKVAQRYQQLLDELRAKARVSIEVTSTPAGADVVVDGLPQGKAPVVVRDLLPGLHFVGMSAEGEHLERKLTVAPGGNGRVDEKLGDPRAQLAKALRATLVTPVSLDLVAAKAKELGDDVVVGALVPDADGSILVVARVKEGATSVTGVRLDKKGVASLKAKADALADAVLGDKAGSSWLIERGAKTPPGTPESVLTSGLPAGKATPLAVDDHPPPHHDDEEPTPPEDNTGLVVVGVSVGVVVVAVAGAVVGLLAADHAAKQLRVSVDASNL